MRRPQLRYAHYGRKRFRLNQRSVFIDFEALVSLIWFPDLLQVSVLRYPHAQRQRQSFLFMTQTRPSDATNAMSNFAIFIFFISFSLLIWCDIPRHTLTFRVTLWFFTAQQRKSRKIRISKRGAIRVRIVGAIQGHHQPWIQSNGVVYTTLGLANLYTRDRQSRFFHLLASRY